jgi:hypothetical protein
MRNENLDRMVHIYMLKMLDLSLAIGSLNHARTLYRVYESIAVENLSLFMTLSAINMYVGSL